MSALTAELMTSFERWRRKQLPLGPTLKAFKGGSVIGDPINAWVAPGKAGTGLIFLGIFAETIDNTASTTATKLVNVDFLEERNILWRANDGTIDATHLFNPCFVLDDQTVTATATGHTPAGTILAVDPVLGVAFEVEGI